MKKKILLILVMLFVLSSLSFGATRKKNLPNSLALGVAYNFSVLNGINNGFMLSFKIPSVPLVIGATFALGTDIFHVGATFDWWLYRVNLAEILDLYVGPGILADVKIQNGNGRFATGIRVPVGLQIWPIHRTLEIFLELAPGAAIVFDDPIAPAFVFNGGLGVRFWFESVGKKKR